MTLKVSFAPILTLDASPDKEAHMSGAASRQNVDNATVRLFVRPPFLFLGCLVLGLVLDYALPLPVSTPSTALISLVTGGGLILVGGVIFAVSVSNFSRAGTPVPATRPVRTLVTTGTHGWSRNPIYVGMFLLYDGIGLAARSPWILLLTLPIGIVMRYVVVAREEVYLERRFGDSYRSYKARVRRWL
jgi:protein-S-isoprenylcysteine O-methyltransferase Ste14